MIKNKITILLLIVLLLSGFSLIGLSKNKDTAPPQIRFSNVNPVYDGNTSKLLNGVTAFDDVDGDVTDSLIIDSVIKKSDNKTAIVRYIAKDKSQNVACEEKEIECSIPAEKTATILTSSDAPVIKLISNDVTVNSNDNYIISDFVQSIVDNSDTSENLLKNIKVDGDYNFNKAGTYKLVLTVTNSRGITSEPAPITITVK